MPSRKLDFIERHFFRPSWYSVLFNPYFIGRRGLLRQIENFSKSLPPQTRILDVGCGNKPYLPIFRDTSYTGIEVSGGGHDDKEKRADQFFDGLNIPFESGSFDAVICTQVLEHSTDPAKLMGEIERVIKPPGQLFLTVPFVWNEHEIPYDFRRLTRYGINRLLEQAGMKIESLNATTGVFGVAAQIISAYIFESLRFRNSVFKLIISVCLLAPIQASGLLLDKITGNSWITLDYAVIAKKC